ncbi:MAG: DUF1365 domain-containing protein [Sphingomonadaceae bacterium]|nr:DUF1365 domain-containing protein [Sphingomonadaceae bacterium]
MAASGLYAGYVMHRRVRPRHHRLRYRLFMLLLDLDEVDGLDRSLRLFSRNRRNIFSFRDRDHADGGIEPLRAQVERMMRAAGVEPDGGAIRLLTMPRILGFAFNPLSVYFCHRRDDTLAAIVYEVNNTFGERHSYLLPAAAATLPIRHATRKTFHVSPFMAMDMAYAFRVTPPGGDLAIAITGSDRAGPLITAALRAERRPLDDRQLLRAFFAFPLLTFKVVAAILWEALKLWIKRVPVRDHPPPPTRPVTFPEPASIPALMPTREAACI